MTIPQFASTHILQRTGDAPLRFSGKLIAEISGATKGAKADRWFEISIYDAGDKKSYDDGLDGRYVLRIVYQSNWARQEDTYHHVVLIEEDDDKEAASVIMDEIDHFDPVGPHFVGFPPLERFRERQDGLKATLVKQFDDLVGELMADEECAKRFAQEA